MSFIAPIALWFGSTPPKETREPEKARYAAVELISELPHVAPGGEVLLGVVFTIKPDWHIYWNGQNDSGTAPEIEWTLPDGWSTGDIRWPAPIRHVSPGDLIDHVYERHATLLISLKAPKAAAPGSKHAIRAKVNYLVCNEACVPEAAELSATIVVANPDSAQPAQSDSPRNARIDAAEKRLPQPLSAKSLRTELTWEGFVAQFFVPEAARLEFYPSEGGASIKNLVRDGASESNRLRLTLDKNDASKPLDGVLAVHFKKRPSLWYEIRAERGVARSSGLRLGEGQ